MTDLTNQFVPYETAKELQELGFTDDCFGCFTKDEEISLDYADNLGEGHYFQECAAPLFQQAFDFFEREFRNLLFRPCFFQYINNLVMPLGCCQIQGGFPHVVFRI